MSPFGPSGPDLGELDRQSQLHGCGADSACLQSQQSRGRGEAPRLDCGSNHQGLSMMKVALTGNVASGKSEVARIWTRNGISLVSADDLARDAVRPGTPGLEAVVEAFGSGILKDDGTLDRDRLRRMVFGDSALRQRLEEILHPIIRSSRDTWMEREEDRGTRLVVAEIPLLFEAGLQDEYDVVVLVDASYEERLHRLTALRGLEEEEARRILDAQMPSGEKVPRATFVLYNHGTLEDLETRALALLDLLRARAAAGRRDA